MTKTIKHIQQGLAQKKFSSVEITQEYLDRIESYNSAINCFITITDELALQQAKTVDSEDEYLDDLAEVQTAGYLDEYVARFLKKRHWELPDDLETRAFRKWQRKHLRDHESETRIIGSWNYARNVSDR